MPETQKVEQLSMMLIGIKFSCTGRIQDILVVLISLAGWNCLEQSQDLFKDALQSSTKTGKAFELVRL